jgi:hypothetical protein
MTDLIRRMTLYAGPLRIDIGGGAPFRCLALAPVDGKWSIHPRRNGRAGWEVAVRKKGQAVKAGYSFVSVVPSRITGSRLTECNRAPIPGLAPSRDYAQPAGTLP